MKISVPKPRVCGRRGCRFAVIPFGTARWRIEAARRYIVARQMEDKRLEGKN